MWYKNQIKNITCRHFRFNAISYRLFVQKYWTEFKTMYLDFGEGIKKPVINTYGGFRDEIICDNGDIMIPMSYFKFFTGKDFDDYLKWFDELVTIAELLQDENNKFYCDN